MKIFLIVLVIIVIFVGVFLWTKNSDVPIVNSPSISVEATESLNPSETMDHSTTTTPSSGATPSDNNPSPSVTSSGAVKTFNLTSKNFSFSTKEIKVRQGDKIKIILSNTEGFHNWVINEFSASTRNLNSGETASVEFVADKKGTFQYYCSIGTHRQLGMAGNLVVE
ncbi:MAG: cupredoxin domain-containing protein [Parcubacteria group bacterium]|nr:cupredoxin domain-containing protein [Parcubacteria group bacterium]